MITDSGNYHVSRFEVLNKWNFIKVLSAWCLNTWDFNFSQYLTER